MKGIDFKNFISTLLKLTKQLKRIADHLEKNTIVPGKNGNSDKSKECK